MPLSKEMQEIQEILAHPGWEHFKALVLGPDNPPKKCLKSQISDKLMASARSGEPIESAKFVGQLDVLQVIFAIPEKELEMAMKLKVPIATN